MKTLREKIEAIPARGFYAGGYKTVTFEAYGDEIHLIHNCPENIRSGKYIKEYFLNNLDLVITE